MTITRHPQGAPSSQGGRFREQERAEASLTLEAALADAPAADAASSRLDSVEQRLGVRPGQAGSIVLSEDGTLHVDLVVEDPRGGYDRIVELASGNRLYARAGVLHRTNGAAVERYDYGPDDEISLDEYHLDGQQLTDPAPDIAMRLVGVEDNWEHWTSGNGHYSTDRHRFTGATIHYRDGDRHRDGAPAVINSDGSEEWWIHGTAVAHPPVPDGPAVVTIGEGTRSYNVETGSRFDPDLPLPKVKAELQADFDRAILCGVLAPGMKAKVMYRGRDITVAFTGVPREAQDDGLWTAQGRAWADVVELIGQSRNQRETGVEAGQAAKYRFHWSFAR